jgi:CMP-2-keto-3-deoxyoctulosonic acid synthetase
VLCFLAVRPFRKSAMLNPKRGLIVFGSITHCMYGYRKETLLEITKLDKSSLEVAESLEQLRWLEMDIGFRRRNNDEGVSIDNP